ncbi:MAG: hypothetical protein PHE54_02775 [Bacilli bacterium]|nr:hypothetical protein [Bacilli bacterium]
MIKELLENEILVFSIVALLLTLEIILIFHFTTKKNKTKDDSEPVKFTRIIDEDEPNDEAIPSELEKVLEKMQQTLDQDDEASYFEKEQEEKAIISYQELLKANQGNQTNQEKQKMVSAEITNENHDDGMDKKNFKNTEVISPIYGKQISNYKYPTIPNFTKKEEKKDIEEEIVKSKNLPTSASVSTFDNKYQSNDDEEFLKYLKSFRKNLD